MRRWLIVLSALACAAPAHAGQWKWDAPASCPEAALRAALALRVDTRVDALPFDVDISIIGDDRSLTATLVIGGAITDSRSLTSASCGELADALAIVIARLAAVTPATPPPPPPEPAPTATVVSAPVIAPTSADAPDWNAGARISGIVGTGGAPQLGIAADVGAWGTWRSLALELAVTRWKTSTATVGDRTMVGVDVGLTAFAVRAGWRSSNARSRAWIVGELGSMTGTGVGFDQPRRGSARWSAAGVGGALAWPVATHVVVVAAAEVEFLIDHVTFTLDSGSPLYRTPPFGLRASLGIELGWR